MEKKKIWFIQTCFTSKGNNMIASIDSNNNCRYIVENANYVFPNIYGLDNDEKNKIASDFLKTINDDSTWNGSISYNELFPVSEYGWSIFDCDWGIVAEIEKEI